jgi:hypothetical protein
MHSIRLSLATALLLVSFAHGTSVHAAPVAFTGTLSFRVGSLPAISVPASGTLTLNGSAGGASLASLALGASEFETAQQRVIVNDPSVFPMAGVQLTARNDAATFDGSPLGAPMRLQGAMKVCLYGTCGSDYNISNLSVPLSIIGYGGTHWVQGAFYMTIVGAPWTTATVSAGTATAMGFVAGAGGNGASTAASQGGHVRLVTPAFIQSQIGAFSFIPIIGTLDLHFVPEPGTLAMLGLGSAGLACAGLRRRWTPPRPQTRI